jgi:hypothetical protein
MKKILFVRMAFRYIFKQISNILTIISACHLLGDYMEAVKQDVEKAFRIYDTNCVVYKHGHSCHKVGSAKMRGKGTVRSMVSYL